MGTITGGALVKDIGQVLSDAGHVNWDKEDDLFPAITEALRAIVMLRPDANPKSGNITLEPDKAIQSLPVNGLALSSITRNRGVTGAVVNGPGITRTTRDILNQALPGWVSHTTADRIRNYIYSTETPGIFEVYPIPTAALLIEGVWGENPGIIDEDTDTIPIDDTYGPAIKEYTLYRLQSMEVEGASINLAFSHQATFFNLLNTKMNNLITGLRLKGEA